MNIREICYSLSKILFFFLLCCSHLFSSRMNPVDNMTTIIIDPASMVSMTWLHVYLSDQEWQKIVEAGVSLGMNPAEFALIA
ncbi:putative membrane protein [Pectobacterium atrosepticum SCRI1043]|uniref:Membrane protein n=1 Tax=Pectobacterium atrosepticum (strain SCRI 1043 / ATCC BAA-672) TaxID=218491 RepID=Q6D4C5_PECAS|nr:hypothetical protein EV46_11880 [Pectobacterium atrosepticum]KFX25490.1 hypothetical protein KP24_02065 [Pectobacterium atrosepticum]CAG75368.1 putative membrane protein [Pectobacterium atrosepticum SCRI1043]